MPRRGSYSLTRRLAVTLALVLALGGISVALAALAYGRSAAQQSFDRLLVGSANQIAESIFLRDGQVMVDLPVSAFELLSLAPDDRIVYAIVERGGAVITGYESLARSDGPGMFYNAAFMGEPIRVARVARTISERAYSGTIEVLVGQTMRARAELARQITRNALIAAAVAGVVMSGLAIFAVLSALSPLRHIEREIAGRATDDLTPIHVGIPRETFAMVGALNRFMTRLNRQVVVMRTLIADASHQLRTPIAALRAQAELAQDETDPDRLRAIVERIHARSLSLSRLTDQLLSHALIIHRADSVPLARIDLRTVAIQAMQETDHAMFGSEIRPRLDLPEDEIWCLGDSLSLVEACKNLLGNALQHGAQPVTLAVIEDGHDVRLSVRDVGPGLDEAFWADAGSRFARDAGVSPESAGLGLSIVQAVATAHGGRLQFSKNNKGFNADLVLPSDAEVTG